MKTDEAIQSTRRRQRFNRTAWFVLIVVLATTAGMFAAWRAPGLNAYAQDFLMRARGDLPEPDDIVIVAIDEASINRLGQFPWRRGLTARVLDKISEDDPKAIALDVLYSEPTIDAEDKALAASIKRAGNVVVGEQLIENRDTPELSRSEWLRALPEIEQSAAGAGHVNVETERDGEAREMLLKLADDAGESRWALALETVRVGDRLNADELSETNRFVRVGNRKIPFVQAERNLFIKNNGGGATTIQPLRMTIDYIGATGSFAAQTVSFADVLDGKIAPERFRGKYVLVGATAATLGDRIAAPFVHTENAEGDQHGDLMPGVEILANSINTILRGRFYHIVSDWTAAVFAALVALAVMILLGLAQGKFELPKQIGVLAALFGLIIYASYLAFAYALVIPPLVPMLVSFAVAAPLALLRRSFAASQILDERINELLFAEKRIMTSGRTAILPVSDNRFSETGENGFAPPENSFAGNFYLPRGVEWKSRALGFLSRDLIARAAFIDSALRSIADGLLVADRSGQVAFANESALRIFNLPERRIVGCDVFELLAESENKTVESMSETRNETLLRLLADRETIEREIIIGKTDSRHYVLRMTAVANGENGDGDSPGIIVTLSDITQHRELQKTKNDVVTLVTHELRTPLTAIQGLSELLTEHEIAPDSQVKMLATINGEAKRLARMVNEYLDITRLESGTQKAHFAALDIENLIELTLLLLEPLAAQCEIKLIRHFAATESNVVGDSELLSRAVTNVVANAIKYSPAKTSVTIETRSGEETLQIIVRDEGFGISADQLPRIFQKFYRVPRRNDAEITGTGLGLALAREIAEMHGGYISVTSEPDKGSIFTINLPLAPERRTN
jgi:signal transduction histidine kinase